MEKRELINTFLFSGLNNDNTSEVEKFWFDRPSPSDSSNLVSCAFFIKVVALIFTSNVVFLINNCRF